MCSSRFSHESAGSLAAPRSPNAKRRARECRYRVRVLNIEYLLIRIRHDMHTQASIFVFPFFAANFGGKRAKAARKKLVSVVTCELWQGLFLNKEKQEDHRQVKRRTV